MKRILSLIIIILISVTTMACAADEAAETTETTTAFDTAVSDTPKETAIENIIEKTQPVAVTTVGAVLAPPAVEELPPPVVETEAPVIATEAAKIALPENTNNVEKTAAPVITGSVNMSPSLICITGKCEKDAVIIVRGGTKEFSFKASDIYFMGSAEVENIGKTVKLQVSAIVDGKAESDPVAVNAMYLSQVKHIRDDAFEVVLGSDSQGHFVSALPDYEGTNIMQDGQVASLTTRIQSRVDWLKENTNGTELIYVIVPNSMTVFPETVPSQYKRFEGEGRSAQFIQAAKSAGATVLNVTDSLLAHKNDGYKLFHKTDSHWTEYGAWVAYTDLMNYISEKWADAKPRTFDEMRFYTKDVDGGDMPYYLGLDIKKVRETATFSNPNFELPISLQKHVSDHGLNMNHDTTPKYKDVKSNRDNLPSAYIMRDSYGIALYDMLAERFNRTVYESMWSYGFDTDKIKSLNVDYVIIVIAERNLGDVLY